MKPLSYKDYTVFDNPKQDEVTILGGKEELKQQEIKELVRVVFDREDFELFKSKVFDASKDGGWEFKYYHYTVSYGPNSMYHPENLNFSEERNNKYKK